MLFFAYQNWPDGVDSLGLIIFAGIALGMPLLGYVFMVLDIRAYFLSLRRALVVANQYIRELPEWVKRDNPRCLQDLGVRFPCTQEEVLDAYRLKVKELHPDRGGDRDRFLLLQQHFEEAMALVASEEQNRLGLGRRRTRPPRAKR